MDRDRLVSIFDGVISNILHAALCVLCLLLAGGAVEYLGISDGQEKVLVYLGSILAWVLLVIAFVALSPPSSQEWDRQRGRFSRLGPNIEGLFSRIKSPAPFPSWTEWTVTNGIPGNRDLHIFLAECTRAASLLSRATRKASERLAEDAEDQWLTTIVKLGPKLSDMEISGSGRGFTSETEHVVNLVELSVLACARFAAEPGLPKSLRSIWARP